LREMHWGRRYAWLRFEKYIDVQTEPAREVRPGVVVRHDSLTLERRQYLFPFRRFALQFLGKLSQVGAISVAGFRIKVADSVGDVLRHALRIEGVRHVMRTDCR